MNRERRGQLARRNVVVLVVMMDMTLVIQMLNKTLLQRKIKSLNSEIHSNTNRLLYSVMYNMERYCTSLYCIENPYWRRRVFNTTSR